MPRTTTIEIPAGVSPESLGLILCYGDVYHPSHNVASTRYDGHVAFGEHVECQRCGTAVCHDDNRDEHMTRIVDLGQQWCPQCRESHAEYDEENDVYNSRQDTHLRAYHSQLRDADPADEHSPFRMGFEIEKEDAVVRKRLKNVPLPNGWVLERDSSLNATTGFEVVTKAYNLRNMEGLRKDALAADWVLKGKFSTACGGHIHISDMRYAPKELYKRILPIFPLFMALFPKRLSRSYCKAAKSSSIGSEKYNAFRMTATTIELRCPSAVRSAKNLLWRAELIKYFLLSSRNKPLSWEWMKESLAKDGRLRSMLIDAYCDKLREKDKGGMEKVNRVVKMTAMFSLWFRDENRLPHDSLRAYLERKDSSDAPGVVSDDEFADDHGEIVKKEVDIHRHNQEQLDRCTPAEEGSLEGMLVLIEDEVATVEPTPVQTTQQADDPSFD
jgi:hypothetical protein